MSDYGARSSGSQYGGGRQQYQRDDFARRGDHRGGGGFDDRAGRERDEHGCFTSDERYGSGGYDREAYGRGEYQNRDYGGREFGGRNHGGGEYDRQEYGRQDDGRGGGQERDRYGRFESADDDRDQRRDDPSRGGSRSSQDEGHRGWFGDPRGHAAASRKGWQHRR